MVKRHRWIVLEESSDSFEAFACFLGVDVIIGRNSGGQGGKRHAVVLVVLNWRVAVVAPIPASVVALVLPHHLERLTRDRSQLAGGLQVVEGEP